MARSTRGSEVTGWTGWISFASFIIALSGIIHVIYGIGGIFAEGWYVYSSGTVHIFDITTWGWWMVAIGVLMILTAILLLSGNLFGRIMGVLLALVSLAANAILINVTPVWSIIAIVVNLFIIYAIIAHGDEMKRRPT